MCICGLSVAFIVYLLWLTRIFPSFLCMQQNICILQARIVMSLLAQRFTFTPADIVECGTPHEYIVPVTPRSGMHVLVD